MFSLTWSLVFAVRSAYSVLVMDASIIVMIIPLILRADVRIGARAIVMVEFTSVIFRVVFVSPRPLNRLPRTYCPRPTRKNWIAYMDRKVGAGAHSVLVPYIIWIISFE